MTTKALCISRYWAFPEKNKKKTPSIKAND